MHSRHTRSSRTITAAVAVTAALGLAACGSDDTASSDAGSGSGDDAASGAISVTHALGETTLEAKPERIATVGWANNEVPLALGVVPVGMAKATYGDDDKDGVLPWVEEKIEELGGETPALWDETDGIDFEAVADSEPDVILAAYSGLTQEDYDTLSEIAPTVAYPEVPWGATMDQMIELDSKAMGMEAEGKELISQLDTSIEEATAKYPDIAGKSVLFAYIDPKDLSQVGFYNTNDPRAAFFDDIGMETPQLVTDAGEKSDEFYTTISAEQGDQLADVDVLVGYGDDTVLKQVQSDPLLRKIPAVERGSVAMLTDNTPLAASANPTPLSLSLIHI